MSVRQIEEKKIILSYLEMSSSAPASNPSRLITTRSKNVVAVKVANPNFTLMRIWIQLPLIMRIHADHDLHLRQNSVALEVHNAVVEDRKLAQWRREGSKWSPGGSVGQWSQI